MRDTHIHYRLLPLHDLICEALIFILVLFFHWTVLIARHSHSFSSSSSSGRSHFRGTHIHSRVLLPLDDLICESFPFILVLFFARHSHSFSFSPSTAQSYLRGTHIHSRSLLPLHDLICEALTFILVSSFPAPDFTDRRPVSR